MVNSLDRKVSRIEAGIPKDIEEAVKNISRLESERDAAIQRQREYYQITVHLEKRLKTTKSPYETLFSQNNKLIKKVEKLEAEIIHLENESANFKRLLNTKNEKIHELQKTISLYNIINRDDDENWIGDN